MTWTGWVVRKYMYTYIIIYNKVQLHCSGEKIAFLILLCPFDIALEKRKFYSYIMCKIINFLSISDLNVKSKIIKILEENIEENLLNLEHQIFFNSIYLFLNVWHNLTYRKVTRITQRIPIMHVFQVPQILRYHHLYLLAL